MHPLLVYAVQFNLAMYPAVLAVIAFIILFLVRVLNITSQPKAAQFYCKDTKFLELLLKAAPDVDKPYVPTRLWGFSGHIQTMLHSLLGRMKCPWPIGERVAIALEDGATLTYDVYQPLNIHPSNDDVTLALCPGICNSSESIYIRTFVHHAQRLGYRCVVLNHIGALKSIRITSPRIFAYGCTKDYHTMVQHVVGAYPDTKIVAIGFSMGGNLVVKYLGEHSNSVPDRIVGGISICQGYDALSAMHYLLQWVNFRRFYLYVMTENMKRTLIAHYHQVFHEDVKLKHQLCERTILSAATLPELDEAYTRKVHGFESVTDLYRQSSCVHYMHNIKVPMIFMNALDDPIVPEELHGVVKNFAESRERTVFVSTAHGGHIGYYEGGLVYPNPVTWLDRMVVGLADGLVQAHSTSIAN